jgi:hypothetical protein
VATPVRVREVLHGSHLQAKFTVGPPGDACEREADRVADEVMRMPEPVGRVQRACAECEEEMQRSPLQASPSCEHIQRLCPECQEEMQRQPAPDPEEDEAKMLRAKETPGQIPEVTPDLESRIAALQGSGQPLPSSDRAFFEPRFGRDFGAVRIHSGLEAADLAQRVHARAFTVGKSVLLGRGEDRPGTEAGRLLLAHELTHVVQQGSEASTGSADAATLQRDEVECESFSPVGDAEAQRLIDNALSSSENDLREAFMTLNFQRTRRANCCNGTMAAAEHYMYARWQVADSSSLWSLPTLLPFIIGYQLWKLIVRTAPRVSDCPPTPASWDQVRWGVAGATDGTADYYTPTGP